MRPHGTRHDRRGLGSGVSSHGLQSRPGSLTRPRNIAYRAYTVPGSLCDKAYVLIRLPSVGGGALDDIEQIGQIWHKVRPARYLRFDMTDLLHQDTGVHIDLDGGSLTIA